MAARVDEAVCIRHWDFSDTSQTVGLFCREAGLIRGIAKGARRERSPFSGGLDLLTKGEVCWVEPRTGELCTLTAWTPHDSWPHLRSDPRGNAAAWYALECVGRMVEPHDPHPALFDGLVAALHGFTTDQCEAAMARLLWCVLTEAGLRPRLETPTTDPCPFDPDEGCLTAARDGAWTVRASTLDALQRTLAGDQTLPSDEAMRAATLLAACVRHHIQAEPGTQQAFFGVIPQGARPAPPSRGSTRHR